MCIYNVQKNLACYLFHSKMFKALWLLTVTECSLVSVAALGLHVIDISNSKIVTRMGALRAGLWALELVSAISCVTLADISP